MAVQGRSVTASNFPKPAGLPAASVQRPAVIAARGGAGKHIMVSAMEKWRAELKALLDAEDHPALLRFSQGAPARTLRYLSGRLYSEDADMKWRAVRALGALAADPALLSEEELTELLRRYLWSLNDESGAVPFGVPEAVGEILARRPSLQEASAPDLLDDLRGGRNPDRGDRTWRHLGNRPRRRVCPAL